MFGLQPTYRSRGSARQTCPEDARSFPIGLIFGRGCGRLSLPHPGFVPMKLTPLEFEKPLVELEKKIEALKVQFKEHITDAGPEIAALEGKLREERHRIYSNLTPWQRVQ